MFNPIFVAAISDERSLNHVDCVGRYIHNLGILSWIDEGGEA